MISAHLLTRAFGARLAVNRISFDVAPGAICAFLGPNGAGKSTTLKLLTGLLQPTSGRVLIGSTPPARARREIGVLPENLALFDHLTIEEHLLLSGPIYGLSRKETRRRASHLLETLGLNTLRHLFAIECSHGTRKKAALAISLLHNPRVLFLDEPFEGIDPVTAAALRELLTLLAARGITVFLTSHILSIVERLATQIVFIRDGRIVWNSAPNQLPRSLEDHYFDLVEAPQTHQLPWLGSPPS